jgi:hypothetical protein
MPSKYRALLAGLLPLFLVIGLSLAAPDHAWGGVYNNQDGNNQDGNNQGYPRQWNGGPAIPEPSAWLAMGVGLLVVAPYARKRFRTPR